MKHIYMLVAAIVLEVIGTTLTKYLLDQQLPGAHAAMLLFIGLAYYCLSKAIKKFPISLAYALWEGLGLLGTAILAWIVFNESMPPQKIMALCVIILGLVMLKKGTSHTGGIAND